jgi:hypothetical protein
MTDYILDYRRRRQRIEQDESLTIIANRKTETIRVLTQNCILCVGHSVEVCNDRQSVGECWIYM